MYILGGKVRIDGEFRNRKRKLERQVEERALKIGEDRMPHNCFAGGLDSASPLQALVWMLAIGRYKTRDNCMIRDSTGIR